MKYKVFIGLQIIIGLLIMFSSCSQKDSIPFKLPRDAETLIAGDSVKVWKLSKRINNGYRMNMGDCFLSYRISYLTDGTFHDNNGQHNDCGPTLRGTWKLVTTEKGSFIKIMSPQLPTLLDIDKEEKFFKIKQLSKNELVLRFGHKQYGNKVTVVIDHLVPENVKVKDRDFHNK